ncbi:hypothetical protein ACOMHN_052671 [Nucella lapillus]
MADQAHDIPESSAGASVSVAKPDDTERDNTSADRSTDHSALNAGTVNDATHVFAETASYPEEAADDLSEEEMINNDRKLFIGNIGYKKNWQDLKDFFSQFGKVEYAKIEYQPLKRRSKGTAFVEFAAVEGATACIDAICEEGGLVWDGRKLRVHAAEESKRRRYTYGPAVSRSPMWLPDQEAGVNPPLNADVLAIIFKYLTIAQQVRSERVCKHWRKTALHVWKRRTSLVYDRVPDGPRLKMEILTALFNRCGTLSNLDLGYYARDLPQEALTLIGQRCPKLIRLDMFGFRVSSEGIKDLSKRLKDLKCYYMVGPKLRCLRVNGHNQMVDYGVEQVAEKCPNLRELHLNTCRSLTSNCLYALIRVLRLNKMNWITDEVISAIADGCSRLREVALEACAYSVSKVGLKHLLGLKELATVNLSYIEQVDDEFVQQLASRGVLQSLSLRLCYKVTQQAVRIVLTLCPNLRLLDLSGCMNITVQALEPLATPTTPTSDHEDALPPPPALQIIIGGTAMMDPSCSGDLRDLMGQLPSRVSVREVDLANYTYGSDTTFTVPEYLEEEEKVEVVPLQERRKEEGGSKAEGCVVTPRYDAPILEDSEIWLCPGDSQSAPCAVSAQEGSADRVVSAGPPEGLHLSQEYGFQVYKLQFVGTSADRVQCAVEYLECSYVS